MTQLYVKEGRRYKPYVVGFHEHVWAARVEPCIGCDGLGRIGLRICQGCIDGWQVYIEERSCLVPGCEQVYKVLGHRPAEASSAGIITVSFSGNGVVVSRNFSPVACLAVGDTLQIKYDGTFS